MKHAFMMVALTLAALQTSTVQASTASDLLRYFHSLEGHWDSQGTLRELQADGTTRSMSYRSDLQIDRDHDDAWKTYSETTHDDHTVTYSNLSFIIRGENLFVNTYGQTEPVQVLESSPLSLTYQVRRAELFTGRVYDFVFHHELNGSARELKGFTTVELNGVRISEESFTAKRW